MSDPSKELLGALVERIGAPLDLEAQGALGDFVTRARSAHPGLNVSADAWAEQLSRTLSGAETQNWSALLERLVAPDVLLAAALGESNPDALLAFETSFVPAMSSTLARLRLTDAEREEVLQVARIHILVAPADGPARISRYGGKGSLEGWIRTTTLRIAMRHLGSRRTDAEPAVLERLGVDPQTEPAQRNRERLRRLRAVVADAFAELPPDHRRLLRKRYIDSQSAVEIAAQQGVHPSTISRRLEAARAALRQTLRSRAKALVGHDTDSGFVETLCGDIETSLRGLFDTRGASDL